ncbi:MAG: hypothetical protein MK322_14800 [Pseudomonadales bacterium]|nr:hypothetical protein [Pseudomonadales bacterium]
MAFWIFLHLSSIIYLCVGIGAAIVPVWMSWKRDNINERVILLLTSQKAFTVGLLPGIIAVLFSGYAWVAAGNYSITSGSMIIIQILFFLNLFLFIPLFGVALRRVKWSALSAQKSGETSEDLEDALADNVPLVFGTMIIVSIPLMLLLVVIRFF